MHWEGFLESYSRIEQFEIEREKIMEELMTRKDELREEINQISNIRKVKEGMYLSVGAVDSSFDELSGDDWGRRVQAVCVSGIGFIPGGIIQKDPEVLMEECILGYEEEGDHARILKGLAFAKEIHSAKKWFSDMDLILIDGSAKSFIIALNQAMTSKNLENSVSGKFLKSIYKETLDALYEMLYMGKLVFAPKRSSEVLIANKISSPINNDYALLEAVLNKGEYIMLEIQSMPEVQPWDYTLPKVEGVSEEFLSKLFNLLKSLKVIYFKSTSGRVVKLEAYIPLSVNTLWEFFLLEGENILAFLVDRSAKHYLSELKRYANEINPWKYRV
jgi:hypothetical protein